MMKRILLIAMIAICSKFTMHGQVFMTELADPLDKTGARYIELFNAGDVDVDLAAGGYGLQRYTNNNTSPQATIYDLTGTIAAKGFYIITKSATTFEESFGFAPDQEITGTGTPVDANGDDKIQLVTVVSEQTTVLDIYGTVGELGAEYCHGYQDGRAERAIGVTTGNAGTWNNAYWNVWGNNTPTGTCANHTTLTVNTTDGLFDPGQWIGYTPSNTIVNFESITSKITEYGVSIDVCVTIENASTTAATTVDVLLSEASTAINGSDYATMASPYTITFPAGSSDMQCLTYVITDDADKEVTETIVLELDNAQGGVSAEIGTQPTHTISIKDNDIVSPGVGTLIVTEVMQNPSAVGDSEGEYFEIYNTTNAAINLLGMYVKDDIGETEYFEVDQSLTVEPGAYFVFGRNGDKATNGGVDVDFEATSLSLANGTDGIQLVFADEVVDYVQWDDGATFPDPNGASMYLLYDKYNATDNDNGVNWSTSTVAFGDGDFGTPGTGNSVPTAISDNMSTKVNIYPNPVTNGCLNMQFGSKCIRIIEVYNILGVKELEKYVYGDKEAINFDLKSGLYLLNVIEENHVTTFKLLIK